MLSTSMKILWALLMVELYVHDGLAGTVKIGGFFGEHEGVGDGVFANVISDAVNRVQNNRTLLPEPHKMSFVSGDQKPVNAVYTAIEDICSMINSQRPSALIVLEDKCPDCSDLAGIMSHGSNPIFSLDVGSFESGSRAFKMYPSAEDMSEFFIDVLNYFKWRAFNLVVDSGDAFVNFEGVMQEAKANDWNVTMIPIDTDDMEGSIMKTTTSATKNILLYCVSEMVCRDFLDKSMEMNNREEPIGSLNSKYTWILGNLDLSLPEVYKDQLEDTNAYMTYFTMNFTREHQYTKPASRDAYDSIYSFPMREKLAFDAVLSIGHALGHFVERKALAGQRGDAVLPGDTQMLTCPTAVDVASNNDLTEELMKVGFEGMTGNVAFDAMGNRVNYTVTIFSGRGDTLRQLRGEWTQNPSYIEDRRQEEWQNPGRLNTTTFRLAKDRKIRIVSIEVPPYLFRRDKLIQSGSDLERFANYRYKRAGDDEDFGNSIGQYTGNGRYEGFIMELLERIRSVIRGIDFEYEVELVPDGKYGAGSKYSKIWNGMVGEVQRGKADVAAGPLTVTGSRQGVVAFTYPFLSSGIQPLVLNPNYVKHDPFRIMYPFSIDVWCLSLFTFFLVSIMLYCFNRFDPYEWKAAVEKGIADENKAENFNFTNSLWFCATSMFLQNSEHNPRSNASRCIVGFWWLFVLFMAFLYLTNLTFFVTSDRRLFTMRSTYDLKAQKTIKYGAVYKGNTYHYLKKTKSVVSLWHKMNNDHAKVYVKNMREGVERVRNSNGNYVLLGESPELRYIASQKPCDLQVVGEYIARTQYSFAVDKDSPLAEYLSGAIEALRDNGVMEDLERDWWDLDDRINRCHNLTAFERAGAFSMHVNSLSGAYYILAMGIVLSVIAFVIDILHFKCTGGKTKPRKGMSNGRRSPPRSRSPNRSPPRSPPRSPRVGYEQKKENDDKSANMWI